MTDPTKPPFEVGDLVRFKQAKTDTVWRVYKVHRSYTYADGEIYHGVGLDSLDHHGSRHNVNALRLERISFRPEHPEEDQ